MHEARRILIDAHAGLHQRPVIGAGQPENCLLIRYGRGDNAHVYASFLQPVPEMCLHLIVDDHQMGRKDIYIILCLAQDLQVDVFSDILIVQRRIGVGLMPSLPNSSG